MTTSHVKAMAETMEGDNKKRKQKEQHAEHVAKPGGLRTRDANMAKVRYGQSRIEETAPAPLQRYNARR